MSNIPFIGAATAIKDMGPIAWIVWSRFFGEAHYILEVTEDKLHPSQIPSTRVQSDAAYTYDLDSWNKDLIAMFIIGICLRILAYAVMVLVNRNKQR